MITRWIRQQHFEYDCFFCKIYFCKKAVLLQIYISVKKCIINNNNSNNNNNNNNNKHIKEKKMLFTIHNFKYKYAEAKRIYMKVTSCILVLKPAKNHHKSFLGLCVFDIVETVLQTSHPNDLLVHTKSIFFS